MCAVVGWSVSFVTTTASGNSVQTTSPGERALREAWESRGLSWRRAVLAAVVERVVLHPCLQGRNVFDPSRIEVVWRT